MNATSSTCVTVLTPGGRGAVAVVAIAGPAAVAVVDQYFRPVNNRPVAEQSVGRVVYGHWGSSTGEDLIVFRRNETALEIHCHGGHQSSAQIVADLTSAGCQVLETAEWLSNHHECPLTAAAHEALARATTTRTAKTLLAQYHGALRREIQAILAELSGENTVAAKSRLSQLLHGTEFGQHLTKPWQVVIAGQPNVGKSSLINALLGYERAIVFDQPGTTRDIVSSSTAIDGWPVQLSDTAGLHETTDTIETAGIKLASQRLLAADLIVWVLDATVVTGSTWELAQRQAREAGIILDPKQTVIVINKADLAACISRGDEVETVKTCAITGTGINQLLSTITTRLVPQVPQPDEAVPFTPEQTHALQAAIDALEAGKCGEASTLLNNMLLPAAAANG